MFEKEKEIWDYLVEHEMFTNDELDLVTTIDGYSVETLEDCLYARYGYRSFEAFMNECSE